MDKFQQDIQRMVTDFENLIARKLPVAAGKIAKQHFQDNFRQGGFVNGGLHPWPPAKRLSSGAPGADSQYRTLMSARNHLFSSIGYTPGMAKVTIFNDVVYAAIHNEGGTVHPRITPKMRRFAWAKYYQLGGGGKSAQKVPNILPLPYFLINKYSIDQMLKFVNCINIGNTARNGTAAPWGCAFCIAFFVKLCLRIINQ